ncbi:hypothetical protein [Spirilliplanes yamanashiensis]|nr:hypothetical protein [Spirilliplanes yamanashiensis]MDP9819873.1 hypothetical protein [Spirilliplanes yamanashiensis]
MAGGWCGDPGEPGERVSLRSDGTFLVEGLSEEVTDELLARSGYVDGYRVKTEFGGVRPTTGAGTWRLYDAPSYAVVRLEFEQLARRAVDDGLSLKVDHEGGDRLLFFYVGDADSGDRHVFRSCGSA